MRQLERRYGWLLHAYPAWYRRERAGEMLGTLVEASPPGMRWPSFCDTRALVIGGLRVRGLLVPCLSILWAGLGAAGAGYDFILSTHLPEQSVGAPQWVGEPEVTYVAATLGALAWLLLTIPVLVSGLIRLRRRWRPARAGAWVGVWLAGLALIAICVAGLLGQAAWLVPTLPVLVAGLVQLNRRWLPPRAGAWVSVWLAGLVLMVPVADWQPSAPEVWACSKNQGCALAGYRYAVVSWGELAVFAGWLALGASMTLILTRSARHRLRCVPDGMVPGT